MEILCVHICVTEACSVVGENIGNMHHFGPAGWKPEKAHAGNTEWYKFMNTIAQIH